MSASTYNTITDLLLGGVLIALVVIVISLIAMIVRWRTPRRRGHAVRLLVSIITIPCLIGLQQFILWRVFLPAQGREQMAEINAARAEKLVETSVVQVGDTAPHFSLTTADGDEFSFPDHGSVILINFFATWCGPCQIELPHVEKIWTANKDNARFRLLVIGREETMEAVRDYRKKSGFSFPIAADPDRSVYSLFAKESIPRTLVVAPDGQIVYSKAGFMEEDLSELNAVLEKQLAGLR